MDCSTVQHNWPNISFGVEVRDVGVAKASDMTTLRFHSFTQLWIIHVPKGTVGTSERDQIAKATSLNMLEDKLGVTRLVELVNALVELHDVSNLRISHTLRSGG